MRKVHDGEKKKRKEKKKKKIMTLIVATNVVASRPPERRPTGTPHACQFSETPSCISMDIDKSVSVSVPTLVLARLFVSVSTAVTVRIFRHVYQ